MRDPIIEFLHSERLRQGRTQHDVAAEAGIPRVTLAAYESDVNVPPLPRLRTWAGALGYEIRLAETNVHPSTKMLTSPHW